MDAPTLDLLTRKERILIHRCQIFLQVECISDIANAEGTRILPEWLDPLAAKPSHSTKNWPQQGYPGKQAWAIWRKFINLAFLTADAGKLKTPLGKWTTKNQNRQHNAYSDGRYLFRKASNGWQKHQKLATRRQQVFDIVPISTVSVVSEDAAPVDISIETGKHVITSKNTGYKTCHEPEQHIKHISTGLTTNAKDLILHHVNMTVDTEDLRNSIIDGQHFEAATDGGFDPTSGVSTYGWVISLDKQVVAMGRGPAAAHPRLAESFRAEGFGIASAASFLQILIQNFNINTNDFTWRLYVDNQAMIKRMESYRTTIPHSRWNLRPDADITNRAYEQITGIPVQYIHVKSHQDNQNPKELGFDAELNIMADELATQQRRLMTEPVITGENLGCTLKIQNIPITRDSQRWLVDFSSRIPMIEYYRKKLAWSEKTFHLIDWDVQHAVLKGLDVNDQRRILKFVHGWLPTNKRLHREGSSISPKCPLCNHLEETNSHLIACSHHEQQIIMDEISHYLQNDIHNCGNSKLNSLLEIALTESINNPNWEPEIHYISIHLRSFIREQGRI
jgi:hypothetical protein